MRVAKGLPVAVSHSRAELYSKLVSTSCPSGENATGHTEPVSPVRALTTPSPTAFGVARDVAVFQVKLHSVIGTRGRTLPLMASYPLHPIQ
jgi:hypothetical protein